MDRDAALIQSHAGLRRNRKALLSDLSALVKNAKSLEAAINDGSMVCIEDQPEELIMKAFNTVTRAITLLDIWMEDVFVANGTDGRMDAHVIEEAQTMPARRAPSAAQSQMQETLVPVMHTTDLSGQTNNTVNNDGSPDVQKQEQTDVQRRRSRSSQSSARYGALATVENQIPFDINRASVTHRSSHCLHTSGASRLNLASIRLSTAHDLFLGCLGSFIGLHLESRSSSELLATTQQAVIACQDMLKVIEAIWERDAQRSDSLAEARESMYSSITNLAEAARNMFHPAPSCENNDSAIFQPEKPMVDAATDCVRAAGECVAESQFVLDRLGDFHFETLQIDFAIAGKETPSKSLSATSTSTVMQSQEELKSTDETLLTLEPPTRPPPIPCEELIHASAAFQDNVDAFAQEEAKPLHVRTRSLLPPVPSFAGLLAATEDSCAASQSSSSSQAEAQNCHLRADSFDCPSAGGSSSTFIGSMRDSEASVVSQSSTRATSPEAPPAEIWPLRHNLSNSQSTLNDDLEEAEAEIRQKTFAHELVYNKEGQITGGTLPALIECLTTHDSTPDATFVATFYLTFRLFATPTEFASALIARFSYIGRSPGIAGPVRLRVYNIFKGWLESHWRNDCDHPALELIHSFAVRQLQLVLPTAGKRLAHLVEKVNAVEGPLVPRLVSSMGKTNTCIATYVPHDAPLPTPILTKGQLAALRNWKNGEASVSILDFDPLELARQFTIKVSQLFCSILPEELLATEWTKKSGSMAVNVRAMSTLSTDLANLVADSILQLQDLKMRAKIIKQWVKIANKCLELANYDSLMAIICSLNSSTILRLKRTWEQVSSKTKAILETLKGIVDCSRNYAVLRQRLQNTVTPCLPFVGTYLTDLTFVDVGNQTTRQLNGDADQGVAVINFDKHVKTAKIISELQRFQIPYRFTEIPELQTWMQDQLVRVRSSDQSSLQSYYRRSLLLEPREQAALKTPASELQNSSYSTRERFEFFARVHPRSADISAVTTPI